ncbi:hypothetical protein PanWU01x14_251590 [Parasponia andersonii]|uniref:Uncharacterized protein n=1 Tax=Parasponia andersonii TaxID=3476 RepID=A0A2P5BCC1_PARAD|nr:hypothetical protein PanWU01x14_251590 [Parasponia andersonii]
MDGARWRSFDIRRRTLDLHRWTLELQARLYGEMNGCVGFNVQHSCVGFVLKRLFSCRGTFVNDSQVILP